MDQFAGSVCGCCGMRFGVNACMEAMNHAGMVCGPVMRLPDEVGVLNDGQPCPHSETDWLGNARREPA